MNVCNTGDHDSRLPLGLDEGGGQGIYQGNGALDVLPLVRSRPKGTLQRHDFQERAVSATSRASLNTFAGGHCARFGTTTRTSGPTSGENSTCVAVTHVCVHL